MPFATINKVLDKKELAELIDLCYRLTGNKETVILADQLKADRLPLRDARPVSPSAIDDMLMPPKKKEIIGQGLPGGAGDREPVHRRSHHRRRALQQGHRHLGSDHRADRRRDDEAISQRDGPGRRAGRQERGRSSPVVQPHLHDGRLRSPRLRRSRSVSSPACAA